jgi:hypothetical protein
MCPYSSVNAKNTMSSKGSTTKIAAKMAYGIDQLCREEINLMSFNF